ncbi:MAG TPA: VOC family protein [Actinomycetota bacterium]|nr:VOC family protein [Actinomycetota bacterium]
MPAAPDGPRVTEVARFSSDVVAAAGFYERLLQVSPVSAGPGHTEFQVGDVKLLVHEAYEPDPSDPLDPGSRDHVAFAVEDLEAACARMREAGVEVVGPQDYDWGRSAYLTDPDGRMVELHEAPGPPEA